jgi:hypothetical protein
MSAFTTKLDIICLEDSIWELASPLMYDSGILGPIRVPTGFHTDLASVPRIPIAFTLFGDRAHHEAVVHDYLYKVDSTPQCTRKQADSVFLEAMKVRGKGLFVRLAMYAGVRLGGWTAWHQRKVFGE